MENAMNVNEMLKDEVQRYPVLYDVTSCKYKDACVSRNAWQEISRSLNISEAECQAKWHLLRDTYVRRRKKLPSGSAAQIQRPWKYADMMSFLLPCTLPRKSISNIPLPEEATTDEINVSLENNGNDSVDNEGFGISSQVSVIEECSTSATQISPFYGESSISTPQGGLYSKKRKKVNVDVAFCKLLEDETTPKDAIHHFMMYGSCVLRSFDEEKRKWRIYKKFYFGKMKAVYILYYV